MSRLMNSNDKIIVKRQYLKPIPGDPELKKIKTDTNKYRTFLRANTCTTCPNLATQMFCRDIDGAVFVEKYCDTSIKENKHIKQNELMDNFDNLFIRAESGNTIYEELHIKNREP